MSGVDYNYNYNLRFACKVNPTTADATQGAAGIDPQSSASVVPGRETGTGDTAQFKGEPTNPEAQAKAAENKQKEIADNNIDDFCSYLVSNTDSRFLKDEAYTLADNLKRGNFAKAAEQYQTLLKAGVITEEIADSMAKQGGIPFKAEMEKVIQQEKANDFADSLNTRDNLKGLEAQYAKNKDKTNEELDAEGLKHGHRSYRRANKKLEKSARRQNALNETYIKDKTYTVDGKTMTGEEAYEYRKKQAKANGTWDRKAKEYTLMSDRGMKTAQKINDKLKAEGKAGILDENGNIDVEKAQAFAREYASTTGNRADKNELKQLAADLHVKEKDVKQFLKGINVDYQKDKRWIGAAAGVAVGAATTYLAAKAFAHGKTTGGTPDTEKTTIENKIITIIDKNGGKHTDTISNVITELIPGAPGKAVSWFSKVLPGLGIGIPAGVATAYLVNSLVNRDVNILKKGHTLAEALDDPTLVKNKGNQEIMDQIKNEPVGPYAADSPEAKMIKLAILGKSMGANENEKGKLNKQELIGALEQIRKNNKDGNTPDLTVEQPGPGKEPEPKPTVTERTVLDIGGDGFFDPDTGGFLKDSDGNNLSQIGDGEGAVGLKGSIGHARDWEKLKQRGAQTEGNDVKAKAQYVIADEKGETVVTPDPDPTLSRVKAYEAPSTIKLRDNTNGKENAYEYEKISDEEAKAKGYVPADAEGPFYILKSASDANRSLKAKNNEVYSLKLEPEEQVVEEKDDKGNITRTKVRRFKYNLEQYKGYAGSNQTSMFWNHRAK